MSYEESENRYWGLQVLGVWRMLLTELGPIRGCTPPVEGGESVNVAAYGVITDEPSVTPTTP